MDVKIVFTGFEQKILVNQRPFFPSFSNTALVTLDASAQSTLNWREREAEAAEWVSKGFYLIWELDFSISDGNLFDQAHFMTLQLAVDHFNQTIWPKFSEQSIGVLVHRGEIAAILPLLDPLKSLAAGLPDESLLFLKIETASIRNAAHYIQLVRQDLLGHFIPLLSGKWAESYPYAFPSLAWGHSHSPLGAFSSEAVHPLPEQRISQALCLSEETEQELLGVIERLKNPFRVISEKILTQEWDGIDEIFALEKTLSFQGRRKLAGFSAAGGKVSLIAN